MQLLMRHDAVHLCGHHQSAYGNVLCRLHNPNSAGGSVILTTYSGTQVVALNGKLVGSVTHAVGSIPMPQGGKLSDCQIIQIRKWVGAGALNN